MADLNTLLTWSEMWKSYKGWKGVAIDTIAPLLLSSLVTYGVARYSKNMYQSVGNLANTTVTVLIALSAFYLVAYTFVVSFLLNNHLPLLMSSKSGEQLKKGLNATFAASLMFSSGGLVTAILIQAIAQHHIPLQSVLDASSIHCVSIEVLELWVNRMSYGLLLFLTLLPICTTFFSIRDIYLIGQLSLVEDIKKKRKNRIVHSKRYRIKKTSSRV